MMKVKQPSFGFFPFLNYIYKSTCVVEETAANNVSSYLTNNVIEILWT